ncbi:MAG TPA: DUF2059 domain-containing protein [Flavobacteriaceae bacterium]|nr:DUF2059 domain-containing protein [Flavobacteriaceae bacterium]
MKKTVMLIALFVGFIGFSQEKDEYRQEATKLVKLQTEDQLMAMLKPIMNSIPKERQEAFLEEVNASLNKLYPSVATIYMESFTHSEINQILEFYESPIGKKMLAKMPSMMNSVMEIGQEWASKELRPLMQKYQ